MDLQNLPKAGLPRVLYFVSAREERGRRSWVVKKSRDQYFVGMLTPLHYSLNLMFGFGEK